MSALSNRAGGGVILFGVDERQRFAVPGVGDPQQLQEDIASAGADLTPPVRPVLSVGQIGEKVVVAAEIPETPLFDKPCFVTAAGLQSGSYVRVGLSNRRMTSYEIFGFVSARKQPKFDSELVGEATLDDLDLGGVQEHLKRITQRNPGGFIAQLAPEDAMCRLGVVVKSGAKFIPTLAGLLVFGVFPQQFEQQLRITFVHYFGISEDELGPHGERFVDNRSFEGPIPAMLDAALFHIVGALRKSSLIDGLFRREVPEYPELALREALVNAVAHRDYSNFARGSYIQVRLFSDRLEIQSPGGLYGTVTTDNMDFEQSTRNRSLMRMLEDLRLSENRGSGVPAMIGAMRAAHLTPPLFDDKRSSFWVTFRNHTLLAPEAVDWLNRFGAYRLTDDQRVAMVFAHQNGIIANSDYRALCNVDIATATRELRNLCEQGIFVQFGTSRWTTYSLAPQFVAPIAEQSPRSEAEAAILRYVVQHSQITNREVQALLRVNRIQATRLLTRLREVGLLAARGTGRWTVYVKPE